ncbi:MAG: iron-containing alcohol dehydrogenase [Clostridia bacterium]|nr:iron-containing alcohol dehydrogenase [Lachnospiraceae bacterium]NCB99733.1 iron-containing alcohol dehydrogenase [Clostridia bacterium]NCD01695.1 iron-containing alcohol dehydrogenase [Clostridia bacterium]
MSQEFMIPEKIITGKNALSALAGIIADYGEKALIVTGKSSVRTGSIEKLEAILTKAGIEYVVYDHITGEPTTIMVENGLFVYKKEKCDFLIGLGGGSPMDAMKAIGIMARSPGRISDYMGKEIFRQLPPMIAIPTTAGTGSEVTQFTIITDVETDIKMLLRGKPLMPKVAVLEPKLSLTTSKNITSSTGLDALTHSIEAYTSRKAQPLSDTFAVSAVRRIFKNLPVAYKDGYNLEAREEMSMAALEAGIAFNNSSVTLVHGMSRPIGALFHVPHGISNAMLLKVCLGYALEGACERFALLGREIGEASENMSDEEAANAFLAAVVRLCRRCEVPSLAEYGIQKAAFFEQIQKMAQDAMASGSPSNTRRSISEEDIINLYKKLWD